MFNAAALWPRSRVCSSVIATAAATAFAQERSRTQRTAKRIRAAIGGGTKIGVSDGVLLVLHPSLLPVLCLRLETWQGVLSVQFQTAKMNTDARVTCQKGRGGARGTRHASPIKMSATSHESLTTRHLQIKYNRISRYSDCKGSRSKRARCPIEVTSHSNSRGKVEGGVSTCSVSLLPPSSPSLLWWRSKHAKEGLPRPS